MIYTARGQGCKVVLNCGPCSSARSGWLRRSFLFGSVQKTKDSDTLNQDDNHGRPTREYEKRFTSEQHWSFPWIELIADPAHQQVNPNTVDDHLFKSNSHSYGQGVASGGSSTWDAIETPKPKTDQPKQSEKHNDKDYPEHRAYHGIIAGTASINNILGSEVNRLPSNSPEEGKPRGKDPTEAAHHVDHHDPSTKEKIMGTLKAKFGKMVGNEDLRSEGDALRKGNVEKGSE
jgi:hypothetical protein